MAAQPRLLVVDDEEAICEGCRRIFTRQGFQVSKSNKPHEGLERATTEDYAAILLDIKMPEMSGLDFLSRLRSARRNTPVILMTGYPSVPTAISAVQLGASGYVMKPFTPEEITQAVHHLAPKSGDLPKPPAEPQPQRAKSTKPAKPAPRLFWNESWLQYQTADLYRVGAMLPNLAADQIRHVGLPSIGQVVYQGLPLAEIVMADGTRRVVPSPLTGVVQAVNDREELGAILARSEKATAERGSLSHGDRDSIDWIADLCATRPDEELKNCTTRRVMVVSTDAGRSRQQRDRLAALGCDATRHLDWGGEELGRLLTATRGGLVVLDAAALDERGPALAAQISQEQPGRVLVLDDPQGRWEKAYRAHKILYYALDPLAENELVEVLDSAFRKPATLRGRSMTTDETVASIQITNRKGSRVTLIAAPGVLRRNSGLGAEIRGLLYDSLYPIQTLPGLAGVAPRDVLNAAQHCDRVILLLAKDSGSIPGSLIRDRGAELVELSEAGAGKVTTLLIQPPAGDAPVDSLDSRTLVQLARHIVQVMATA